MLLGNIDGWLAADTNGWATWSTGAFDIHEGGRVVLDTGELGRLGLPRGDSGKASGTLMACHAFEML